MQDKQNQLSAEPSANACANACTNPFETGSETTDPVEAIAQAIQALNPNQRARLIALLLAQ